MGRQIDLRSQRYMMVVATVLARTDAWRRKFMKRERLPGGVPFRFVGYPVFGPQAATITLQIDHQDLDSVMKLEEKLALQAGAEFVRVYRDRQFVRTEFTLPPAEWRLVRLAGLLHRKGLATIGKSALGPVARMEWKDIPHKLFFGATRSGKSTCLIDVLISLARTNDPDECRFLIANPKNDSAFKPLERLRHLERRIAVGYEASIDLLRYALAEMELRISDPARTQTRLVVAIDELAQLADIYPDLVGHIITRLSQMSGGLNMNIIGLSQAASPKVFGHNGSLAKANFPSRIIFNLPNDQAYLATGMQGRQPNVERLGITRETKGDGLAVMNGRVIRFRAALPGAEDFDNLPRFETEPEPPPVELLAGDRAVEAEADGWQIDPDRLAYALVMKNSATAIREQFGGGTNGARLVRDYAELLKGRIRHWRAIKVARSQGRTVTLVGSAGGSAEIQEVGAA